MAGEWLPSKWDPGCGSVVAIGLSTFEIPAEYTCGDAGMRLCGDCIEAAKACSRDRYHEKKDGLQSIASDHGGVSYPISDYYREAYFGLVWERRRAVISAEALERVEEMDAFVRSMGRRRPMNLAQGQPAS